MIDSFVAVDLETTGLSPEANEIIEIGAVRVRNGKVVARMSQLINPNVPLTDKVRELTGIQDEMLITQPVWSEVVDEVEEFLGDDILLGHNIKFDYSFLKQNFYKVKKKFEHDTLDTLYLSRMLLSELPSKSLGNLCNHYGIVNECAHRAVSDAIATMELYQVIAAEHEKNHEELFLPQKVNYKVKKDEPITARQKNYLIDLIKYHKINKVQDVDILTKSEASRLIDKIIFQYGRMQ
ncbi:DNA polymerase III polC-type [Lachnospiraceae bacterium KM106-2]|nr:DNA polymerase III polC-type [Lachnospiraceae bacterium KM106-2]